MSTSSKFRIKEAGPACRQAGFAHMLVLMAVFGVAAVLALSGIQASHFDLSSSSQDIKGVKIAKGDDSGSSDSSGGSQDNGGSSGGLSGSSGSSGGSGPSSNTGTSGGSGSSGSDGSSATSPVQVIRSAVKEVERSPLIQAIRPTQKVEKPGAVKAKKAEIETEDLENEIEDELQKPQTAEIRFENKNGRIEVKVKNATGSAVAATNLAVTLAGQLGVERVRIKIGQGASEQRAEIKLAEGKLKIEVRGESALSDFPLFLDKTTNQLMVTTPAGPRVIRILPDRASEIAKSAGIQTKIGDATIEPNTPSNTSDEAVIKVKGIRSGKLFSLIPVVSDATVNIGAETGTVLGVDQPAWWNLLAPFIK